ncbi:hypothetical protein [Subtercola boreus]|uniref:Uncharacterized protein n=1 Tax=Subtercola boreus TaxID=120213 RepID=A0A3E0WDD1_9MICO|nr:hypothetical protein [Subtercola boreus]RFA22105.1 hypothetical protein B7R24_05330 [Subtercola boreus]RFA22285.1 hypothetical protein B7R23_05275 [Subtercola boreus]RFA28148.1 hypothetical protein B7R25_05400 [Subtercola boreus]
MVHTFSLVDALSLGDLKVFLGRAARVGTGSVRLIGGQGVLAVYASVLAPKGLLDTGPTVLGLRTFALTDTEESFDEIISIRALLDRLALLSVVVNGETGPVDVTLPPSEGLAAWAGISPPRGGWTNLGLVDTALLEKSAGDGISEVAAALPPDTGEQIVHRVRSQVWGRAIAGIERETASGAAFAAVSLGFLRPEDPVAIYRSGPWTRLSTRRGHVLTR